MALGDVWTLQNSPLLGYTSVAYGDNIFVAVAQSGTKRIASSPDGVNWTLRGPDTTSDWFDVTYGGGLFVAVARTGHPQQVITSPNGIDWTLQTTPQSEQYDAVTFGGGLYVAVSLGPTNAIITSPDAVTWSAITPPVNVSWDGIAYGNGVFVAVANTGGSEHVMTSPDGAVWTMRTTPDRVWNSVTFGNGLFVAVAASGSGDRVMTSPNGVTWTSQTSAADKFWYSVTYAEGLYTAVARFETVEKVMMSSDAITWTLRTTPIDDNDYFGVVHANGVIVAVADSSSGEPKVVMTTGIFVPECTILGEASRYRSEGETTTGTRLLTDDEYRLFIKARIAKNQSKGNINNLVDLILFIVGSPGFILFDGPGQAEFTIGFNVGTLSANDKVFISQSDLLPKPAGVKLNLFEYPANGAFGYVGAPGDIAGYDVGQYIETF